MLKGKKILIGITGSIAAYKIPLLIRLLKKAGAEVQVILTPMARDFVTPLTLSTLSQRPVLTEFYEKGDGSWNSHVDLGIWADLFLLAPLSANTMGKIAGGIADNLLLTTVLSARCPIFFAPAMDLDMYKHQTTQYNISKLKGWGYHLIEPTTGELASGLKGFGRMEEPEVIYDIIEDHFRTKASLEGRRCLVTAGPTYEPIDPVRFIGNFSTGRMGWEVARELANRGATVDLVMGPTALHEEIPGVTLHSVTTAQEMLDAAESVFDQCTISVMAAAVADFRPAQAEERKIKKENKPDNIALVPTVDVLATLGKRKAEDQLLVGFALETHNELEEARRKLERKNLDMIVMNSLQDEGAGFGHHTNKITLITRKGEEITFPLKEKSAVAVDIVDGIVRLLKNEQQ